MVSSIGVKVNVSDGIENGSIIEIRSTVGVDNLYEIRISDIKFNIAVVCRIATRIQTYEKRVVTDYWTKSPNSIE